MGSSQKQGNKILGMISKVDAERLLTDWANLSTHEGKKSVERMCSRHPGIFGAFDRTAPDWWLGLLGLIGKIQVDLRNAWETLDQREREWKLLLLRQSYHQAVLLQDPHTQALARGTDGWEGVELMNRFSKLPPVTPFEAAVWHFQKIADRAKYCGNEDCPARYFIAAKGWQKFCSEACAGPVNREQKRRWWHEHKGKGLL